MDYVSAHLSRDEVVDYLATLPSVLAEMGFAECNVMYGWDCDLPIDDLWQDRIIKVSELHSFVALSIERGIFRPGASDLFVSSLDGALSIRACHESDIHLGSTSEATLAALAAPIATRHPEFNYKQGESWKVRAFRGLP